MARQLATLLTASLLGVLSSRPVRADQFAYVDGTFTHDKRHVFYVPLSNPSNWRTPVNYAEGNVHFFLEVLAKPSDAVVKFYINIFRSAGDYSLSPYHPGLTKPGRYSWTTPLASFSRYSETNWTQMGPTGSNRGATGIRDANNVKPDPGEAFIGAPNLGLYFPMKIRFKVIVVSKGAALEGDGWWISPADAGTQNATPRDAASSGDRPEANAAMDAPSAMDTTHRDTQPDMTLVRDLPVTPGGATGADAAQPIIPADGSGPRAAGCSVGGTGGSLPLGLALTLLIARMRARASGRRWARSLGAGNGSTIRARSTPPRRAAGTPP